MNTATESNTTATASTASVLTTIDNLTERQTRIASIQAEEQKVRDEIASIRQAARAEIVTEVTRLLNMLPDEASSIMGELTTHFIPTHPTPAPQNRVAPAARTTGAKGRSPKRKFSILRSLAQRSHSKGFRLNEAEYKAIRALGSVKDINVSEVSKRFHVSRQTIYSVLKGPARKYAEAA